MTFMYLFYVCSNGKLLHTCRKNKKEPLTALIARCCSGANDFLCAIFCVMSPNLCLISSLIFFFLTSFSMFGKYGEKNEAAGERIQWHTFLFFFKKWASGFVPATPKIRQRAACDVSVLSLSGG